MKFLHVSTGDDRGAFAGAYRLHRNLIDAGHESRMLVGKKASSDAQVIAPSAAMQRLRLFLEKAGSAVARLVFGREEQRARIFKLNAPLVPVGGLLRGLGGYQPDLIIVYYVADFLSERQLQAIQRRFNAPMAFYLMDMGMLTGGCHYAWNCPGYLSDCGRCPQTGSFAVRTLLAHKWRSRQRCYQAIAPVVVAGSEQLHEQARRSGLCREFPVEKILMGVSPEAYSPDLRPQARAQFGLAEQDLVFYFGAQDVTDRRKGFDHLCEALRLLGEQLSPEEQAGICLFTVGAGDPVAQRGLGFRHVHCGYISDPRVFRMTYAAADLFICPSVEDSGPMMINESAMSGTPVAAFDGGVAKDLVIHGTTGYRVALGDARALAESLAQFVRLSPAQRAAMSAAARQLALDKSASQGQVAAFVDLAQRLRTSRRGAA